MMNESGILVSRGAVEEFSHSFMQPGMAPVGQGRARAWIDKTFKTSDRVKVTTHGLRNYLTLFICENEQGLQTVEPQAFREALASWISQQAELQKGAVS